MPVIITPKIVSEIADKVDLRHQLKSVRVDNSSAPWPTVKFFTGHFAVLDDASTMQFVIEKLREIFMGAREEYKHKGKKLHRYVVGKIPDFIYEYLWETCSCITFSANDGIPKDWLQGFADAILVDCVRRNWLNQPVGIYDALRGPLGEKLMGNLDESLKKVETEFFGRIQFKNTRKIMEQSSKKMALTPKMLGFVRQDAYNEIEKLWKEKELYEFFDLMHGYDAFFMKAFSEFICNVLYQQFETEEAGWKFDLAVLAECFLDGYYLDDFMELLDFHIYSKKPLGQRPKLEVFGVDEDLWAVKVWE